MNLDSPINSLPEDLIYIKLQKDNLLIEGKGTIYNKNKTSLAIKLYISKSENFDPFKYFSELLTTNYKAGQLISNSIYFSFFGESAKGDKYSCDKAILVDTINSEILNVELKDYLIISNYLEFTEYKIVKIIVPFEIKIHCNRALEVNRKYSDKWSTKSIALDLFETQVNDLDIDIFSDQGRTIILLQTKSKKFSDLNDIYPITDSLGFLTSTVIDNYDVQFESNRKGISKKIICPSLFNGKIVKMNHPPLQFGLSYDQTDYYLELFNRFYLFRIQNKSSELAYCLRQVILSENSSISNYSLTLTTTIESLSKAYFSEYAKEVNPEKVIDAKEKIRKIDIEKQLKERILGLLDSIFGQLRAKDILVELSNKNIISKREYTSWTKLRNSSTHGDKPVEPLQELIDLCSVNIVLFYKLIFSLIEYTGLYTDYSEYGYPEKDLKKNAS